MQTSNFSKSGNEPKAVCISRSTPPGLSKIRRYMPLAPSSDLLINFKAGKITEEEYIKIYTRDVLDKLDPVQVISDIGDDAILVCYCGTDSFCHRKIVASWLTKTLGLRINEVPCKKS